MTNRLEKHHLNKRWVLTRTAHAQMPTQTLRLQIPH